MRLTAGLVVAALLGVSAVTAAVARADESVESKIATLAPKGSAWAKRMEKTAREIADKTEGRVHFKYYFSGQQGDERDVVRKMTGGQLDGAALTAVGLGLIKSDVRVLELPAMFHSYEEIDYVRGALEADFEQLFVDAGYVLLSWGDVGWVYTYSKSPIATLEDLAGVKMWTWQDDPIARAMQERMKVNGVPLGVPEVLGALQTGMIDGCYGPPLAAIALQWYTKVKYMSELPTAYGIGALVVRKDVWESLRAADRELILAGAKKDRVEATKSVRSDNERARKAMLKVGVKTVKASDALVAATEKAAMKVWDELAGKLYGKELLAKVKKLVAEKRK